MSDGHGATTSLNVPWTPAPASKRGYGPDPGCQPCPDCGGLQCLCRPRFFAGQLLTEQDLNRLDHYIVEKNKLHNRHLVGWGVVCGLEVLCDQCGDGVRVTPGYAISPCGEDIVVCKPDNVDICALIDRCRKSDEPDCRPYAGKDGCEDVEEEWVLAIRFMESPARGMTALTGPASCACGASSASCGCGGKSGSGCSCAGTPAAPAASESEAPRVRRGAPPSCEPTVVCETYRYEIFRAPAEGEKVRPSQWFNQFDEDDDDKDSGWLVASFAGIFEKFDGELARRITCCLRDLEKAFPAPPADDVSGNSSQQERQAWIRWACAAKRSLGAYLGRMGGGNCEAVREVGAILVPNANSGSFEQEFADTAKELLLVAVQAMLHCVCSNLLPACPAPEDPRVPLAVVTVRRTGCDVVKVCNWTPLRRHVTTFRSLDYWFGWLPLREWVRDGIEAVCCRAFGLRGRLETKQTDSTDTSDGAVSVDPKSAVGANAGVDHKPPEASQAQQKPAGVSCDTPLELKLSGRRRKTGLGAAVRAGLAAEPPTTASLFDLTFRRPAFPTGGFADEADEKRMNESLAQSGLAKVLGGLVRSTGVQDRAMEMLGGALAARRGGGGGDDLSELRARLDRQDAEIAELRRGLARGKGKSGGKSGGKS